MSSAEVQRSDQSSPSPSTTPSSSLLKPPLPVAKPSSTTPHINVVVLSSAGKPIFSRFGDEEALVTAAGLVQAIFSFAEDAGTPLRHMKTSSGRQFSFLARGALYLLGVSSSTASGSEVSEHYMCLLLEYVYGQIVFTLTSKVQAIFKRSQNFDLRGMLGATDNVIRSLLDKAESHQIFLTAGVEVLPLPPAVRGEVSRVLAATSDYVKSTLFAVLLAGQRLVTIVQPSNPEHQLKGSDLHLLMNFVHAQSQSLMASESWFPVCLPTFNSTGFVYAYTCCLHEPTGLFLLLFSTQNSPDQFHMFQNARAAIVHALGLKSRTAGKIIHQHSYEDRGSEAATKPAAAGGGGGDGGSGGGGSSSSSDALASAAAAGLPLPPSSSVDPFSNQPPLLRAILESTTDLQSKIVSQYCSVAGALHFLYRTDVPVGSTGGRLTQTLCPTLQFPFVDQQSKARVWSNYQKLVLRLRSGSCRHIGGASSFGDDVSSSAAAASSSAAGGAVADPTFPPLSQEAYCRPPESPSVAYLVAGSEFYAGVAGAGFEIYAVMPATTNPREAISKITRLVRKLRGEAAAELFISNPPVFST